MMLCTAARWLIAAASLMAFGTGFAPAAEVASVPVYSPAQITFAGPRQSAADTPARDVQLAVTFRHESGSPELTVHGFFDGDGAGRIDGNVFQVRFCPTRPGQWTIVEAASNALE